MTDEEIFWNLCRHDKRYPMYDFDDEQMFEVRKNCSCDNCFYRRDILALEIIKLRGL